MNEGRASAIKGAANVMRRRFLIALATGLFALGTSAAHAGMPSLVLTDAASLRLEAISFFLVCYLLCTLLFRWIWNGLAKDWAWMPRLSFRKALGVMIVFGLFCYVILTMISGARELMTPGAWKKEGLLYKLDNQP